MPQGVFSAQPFNEHFTVNAGGGGANAYISSNNSTFTSDRWNVTGATIDENSERIGSYIELGVEGPFQPYQINYFEVWNNNADKGDGNPSATMARIIDLFDTANTNGIPGGIPATGASINSGVTFTPTQDDWYAVQCQ